jgi:hypothetical protein
MPTADVKVEFTSVGSPRDFARALKGAFRRIDSGAYVPKKDEPTPKMTKTQQFKINSKVEHSPAKTKRRAKARVASRSRRINRHKR